MIPATREEALQSLHAFLPQAATYYSKNRNFDGGPSDRSNVSLLSASLQRRIITEQEVIRAVLNQHSFEAAEKFIQEILWRSYWKSWLELRPSLWRDYLKDREKPVESDNYTKAVLGNTGIDCFDLWREELQETGYLHNHARMWFSSIWIFTLGLPWQKGAELFENELLDFDSASNTLSWRWVAGLHTAGKHYLARAENIEKFTRGRFNPQGQLREEAAVPGGTSLPIEHEPRGLTPFQLPAGNWDLLIHEEDYSLEETEAVSWPFSQVFLLKPSRKNKRLKNQKIHDFERKAFQDLLERTQKSFACPLKVVSDLSEVTSENIITVRPWVGYLKEEIGLFEKSRYLKKIQREYDCLFVGQARSGFFTFKEKTQALLEKLMGQSSKLESFYEEKNP